MEPLTLFIENWKTDKAKLIKKLSAEYSKSHRPELLESIQDAIWMTQQLNRIMGRNELQPPSPRV